MRAGGFPSRAERDSRSLRPEARSGSNGDVTHRGAAGREAAGDGCGPAPSAARWGWDARRFPPAGAGLPSQPGLPSRRGRPTLARVSPQPLPPPFFFCSVFPCARGEEKSLSWNPSNNL